MKILSGLPKRLTLTLNANAKWVSQLVFHAVGWGMFPLLKGDHTFGFTKKPSESCIAMKMILFKVNLIAQRHIHPLPCNHVLMLFQGLLSLYCLLSLEAVLTGNLKRNRKKRTKKTCYIASPLPLPHSPLLLTCCVGVIRVLVSGTYVISLNRVTLVVRALWIWGCMMASITVLNRSCKGPSALLFTPPQTLRRSNLSYCLHDCLFHKGTWLNSYSTWPFQICFF